MIALYDEFINSGDVDSIIFLLAFDKYANHELFKEIVNKLPDNMKKTLFELLLFARNPKNLNISSIIMSGFIHKKIDFLNEGLKLKYSPK